MFGVMPYGVRPHGGGARVVATTGAQFMGAATCRSVAAALASSGIVLAGGIGVSAVSTARLTSAITLAGAIRLNSACLGALRSENRLVGALAVSVTSLATLGDETRGILTTIAEGAAQRLELADQPLCGFRVTDAAPVNLALGEVLY